MPKLAKTAPKRKRSRTSRTAIAVHDDRTVSGVELKKLAAARMARAPERLLAQIGQFAPMSPAWLRLDAVKSDAPAWRPSAPFVVIAGDLRVSGNVVIGTGKHDFGIVIVLGSVGCRNFATGAGWTCLVAGDLHAEDVIVATAADSATYVGGNVNALLVHSGPGAWLTLFGGKRALRTQSVTRAVKIDGLGPMHAPETRANVLDLLIPDVLDDREWKALSAAERRSEDERDYVAVDTGRAIAKLAQGATLLRTAARGRAG